MASVVGGGVGEDGVCFAVPQVVVTVQPAAGNQKPCSRCGEVVDEIHDITDREVRDVTLLAHEHFMRFPQACVRCPSRGPPLRPVV